MVITQSNEKMLSGCKAFCTLLEPFDAEEFAPDRSIAILKENSPAAREGVKYGKLQYRFFQESTHHIISQRYYDRPLEATTM